MWVLLLPSRGVMVVLALGGLALIRKRVSVHVRGGRRGCGCRVAKRRKGRAVGGRGRARRVDVLGDVEGGVGLVGVRVVLEGAKLKIQALERGKPKVAGGHVGRCI